VLPRLRAASSSGVRNSPAGLASPSALSAQEAEAQEASAQEAAAAESLAQEAEAHEALAQEVEAQLALAQEAEAQLALAQDALAQEASAAAFAAHEAELKTLPDPPLSDTRNWFRARFGLGGLVTAIALGRSSTPTPTDSGAASPAGFAASMRAPLT
jgi:hypothetical protein